MHQSNIPPLTLHAALCKRRTFPNNPQLACTFAAGNTAFTSLEAYYRCENAKSPGGRVTSVPVESAELLENYRTNSSDEKEKLVQSSLKKGPVLDSSRWLMCL